MVQFRTFIGVAALALTVAAAPARIPSKAVTYGRRGEVAVNSGCSSGNCGDKMMSEDQKKMDEEKMMEQKKMDEQKMMDQKKMDEEKKMSSGGCGSSGCGDDKMKMEDQKKMEQEKMKMDEEKKMSSGGCGSSGCGDDKMKMDQEKMKMDEQKKMDQEKMKMEDEKKMSGCNGGDCGMKSEDKGCVGSGSGCGAASSAKDTSTSMMEESTSSTQKEEATSVVSSAYETPTYGSGSSDWNQYEDCVKQCLAKFPADAKATTAPDASKTVPDSTVTAGAAGTNGVTHTVVVAPSQGVLRFVPFALNASVGDTVKFEWRANNHTVTKGSALQLCNKTAPDAFASGLQTKGFTYLQAVNDTKPTYFFCNAPNHCQKGMFGIINPGASVNPAMNMGGNMKSLIDGSPRVQAMHAVTNVAQSNATAGMKTWGSFMSLEDIKAEDRPFVAENLEYTRAFIASNPDMWKDGKLALTTANGEPKWPVDAAAVMAVSNLAAQGGAAAAGSAPASSPSGSAPAAAATASPTSGARGLGASGAVVALVAVVASFLAL